VYQACVRIVCYFFKTNLDIACRKEYYICFLNINDLIYYIIAYLYEYLNIWHVIMTLLKKFYHKLGITVLLAMVFYTSLFASVKEEELASEKVSSGSNESPDTPPNAVTLYSRYTIQDVQHAPVGRFSIQRNPFRYSAYYEDEESTLYYCNARFFSTDIMRFLNRDTYDVPNRYAYCNGNPVENTDSNGHAPRSPKQLAQAVASKNGRVGNPFGGLLLDHRRFTITTWGGGEDSNPTRTSNGSPPPEATIDHAGLPPSLTTGDSRSPINTGDSGKLTPDTNPTQSRPVLNPEIPYLLPPVTTTSVASMGSLEEFSRNAGSTSTTGSAASTSSVGSNHSCNSILSILRRKKSDNFSGEKPIGANGTTIAIPPKTTDTKYKPSPGTISFSLTL
jgi:RHS repeat-associated protein